LLGCPKIPTDFLTPLKIQQLLKLELVSNAPSTKAYMAVDSQGFLQFVTNNCFSLREVNLTKVQNVTQQSVLRLIHQCAKTLQKAALSLTSIEKPKVQEALGKCQVLRENKVEKWYIKTKWTEW